MNFDKPTPDENDDNDRSEPHSGKRANVRLDDHRSATPPLNQMQGMHADAYELIRQRFPGNPLKQVVELFNLEMRTGTGRKRQVARKTRETLLSQCIRFLEVLRDREVNMRVQNLNEIKLKHVRAAFRHMETKGVAASSLQNYCSAVRRMMSVIGKPHVVPSVTELLREPGNGRRSYSRVIARNFAEHGLDANEIIAKATALCEITGHQFLGCLLFGFRAEEVVCFVPEKRVKGGFIHIVDGTKGGRARAVPIETEEQKAWIERAMELAGPRGYMQVRWGMTLKHALNHFYRIAKKVGLTRVASGATVHCFRHEYALWAYEKISGRKAPVLGGEPLAKERRVEVELEVADRLGHSRPDISHAYIGCHVTIDRSHSRNLKVLLAQCRAPELVDAAKRAGVTRMMIVGEAARTGVTDGLVVIRYEGPVLLDCDTCTVLIRQLTLATNATPVLLHMDNPQGSRFSDAFEIY